MNLRRLDRAHFQALVRHSNLSKHLLGIGCHCATDVEIARVAARDLLDLVADDFPILVVGNLPNLVVRLRVVGQNYLFGWGQRASFVAVHAGLDATGRTGR